MIITRGVTSSVKVSLRSTTELVCTAGYPITLHYISIS